MVAEMVRQLQILGMEAPQQQVEIIQRYAHRMLQNNADQNIPYNVLREAYDRAFGADVGLVTPPRQEPLQPPPPQTSFYATGMMQEIMTNFYKFLSQQPTKHDISYTYFHTARNTQPLATWAHTRTSYTGYPTTTEFLRCK